MLPSLAALNPSYREALPGYHFSFPRDHFEHNDFQTEWWYYTGNVWTSQGHRFGFELVFFRIGERGSARDNPSAWRIDDVYLANAALTDVDDRRFLSHERLRRAGPGIAGASFAEQRIWNGNWSTVWTGANQRLSATTEDFSFQLDVSPAKPLVIQGENGVSQKAAGLGHASYYISFPRLDVTGKIQVEGRDLSVSGQAWMDHEWFSNDLQAGQVGWDWFSIQLNDNTELMLFELRHKDGSLDSFSSGTFISRDGRAQHLSSADFTLRPLEIWKSPHTGAKYPIVWSIQIPARGLRLDCRAALRDQELVNAQGAKYWEGAVNFSGSAPSGAKQGVGYLEMTGYDKPVDLR